MKDKTIGELLDQIIAIAKNENYDNHTKQKWILLLSLQLGLFRSMQIIDADFNAVLKDQEKTQFDADNQTTLNLIENE